MGTKLHMNERFGASIFRSGMISTMGRESFYTMSMLTLTPRIQEELRKKFGLNESLALSAGSIISGISAAFITHPMDTVKTCMQGDIC